VNEEDAANVLWLSLLRLPSAGQTREAVKLASADLPQAEAIRRAMGQTRRLADESFTFGRYGLLVS
jgi:hypothetical protein